MAIKVITESTKESKPFPKLMIATSSIGDDLGIIVLFRKEGFGTVIQETDKTSRSFGCAYQGFPMECFEDYNLPITLQNE